MTAPNIALDNPAAAPLEGSALAQAVAWRAWGEQHALGMGLKDAADGRYLEANAAFAALFGRSPAETIGSTDAELLDTSIAAVLRAADQTALAATAPCSAEHKFEWRGQRREFSVLRAASMLGGRRVLVALWQDLGPQRQREAQLRAAIEQLEREQKASEALRRELDDQGLRERSTGLYTRAHFDDQLKREVDLSTREHREFTLVYIALDPFSDKVARLGPNAAARIHEAMGRLLRGNTRAMDASCRTDERQFAVLLSGVGLATAHSRMEGLRRQCAAQIVVLDGQEFGFTVSMGVASFPHTATAVDAVINACAAALTEAQRRSGNAVALATIRLDSPSLPAAR